MLACRAVASVSLRRFETFKLTLRESGGGLHVRGFTSDKVLITQLQKTHFLFMCLHTVSLFCHRELAIR